MEKKYFIFNISYLYHNILITNRNADRHEAIENCRRAMRLAHRELDVPMVLEPEYLASPWLDELSGMTYLSYFMKPDSTGVKQTLEWVNSRLERAITNFTVRFFH